MFCPICQAEYREDVLTCADCSVPLVARLPQEDQEQRSRAGTPCGAFEGEVKYTIRDWLPSLKVCVPFLIFGVAIMGAGLFFQQDRLTHPGKSIKVSGTVVRIQQRQDYEGSTYSAVVQFSAPDGKTVELVSDISLFSPTYRTGETVTVLYNPQNGESMMDSFSEIYGPIILIGLLGGAFVLFGAGPFLIALILHKFPNLPVTLVRRLERAKCRKN